MTVLEVGDLHMKDGAKFSGIVIEATRGELQAVAGNVLYKEVEIAPCKEGGESGGLWESELLNDFVQRLCAVDRRIREAKPTRKYSRAEVLAILDEIDPGKKQKGEAANGK